MAENEVYDLVIVGGGPGASLPGFMPCGPFSKWYW